MGPELLQFDCMAAMHVIHMCWAVWARGAGRCLKETFNSAWCEKMWKVPEQYIAIPYANFQSVALSMVIYGYLWDLVRVLIFHPLIKMTGLIFRARCLFGLRSRETLQEQPYLATGPNFFKTFFILQNFKVQVWAPSIHTSYSQYVIICFYHLWLFLLSFSMCLIF